MSAVQVSFQWQDGDSLTIAVEASDGYPDGLAEAAATALRLYREALGVSVETLAAGEDDDG